MKTEPDDPLLSAVLGDDDEFRAHALRQTLALAARRRWWRKARRVAAAAAVLACAVILLRQPAPIPTASAPKRETLVQVIHTAPLPADAIVQTCRTSFSTVATSPGNLAIVRTGPSSLEYLDNNRLLAILRDHRAALVGSASPEVRIISY